MQLQSANETWESVYIDNDTNNKFNSFLHTASFPVKYKSIHKTKNGWITQGIKISFDHKRRLYTYTTGTVMMPPLPIPYLCVAIFMVSS
jgi:hypothetical protein